MTPPIEDSEERKLWIEILKRLVASRSLNGFGFDLQGELFLHTPHGIHPEDLVEALDELSPAPPANLVATLRAFLQEEHRTEEGVEFEMFEGELRPGSGIVRMEKGKPFGFHGCVGLFLERSEDSSDRFFLTAGHLLSEDWKEGLRSEVYRSGAGSSGTGRRRFLGRVKSLGEVKAQATGSEWNRVDAAVVKLDPSVEIDPETTCYDHMGEPATAFTDMVLKCGNEEPIFTEGRVISNRYWFAITREKGDEVQRFLFEEQLLVDSGHAPRPFTRPGDSGCAVISAETREIYGLILGGSVLRDKFIVNRIDHLLRFWESQGLCYRPEIKADRAPMVAKSSFSMERDTRATSGKVEKLRHF